MMRQPIDIHKEITWLGSPAVYLIDSSSESILGDELSKIGFQIRFIDGLLISDKKTMFDQINNAFMFSEYAYPVFNWDAFDESLESLLQSLDSPLAILWRDAFSTLNSSPSDFLNALRYLVNESVPATCNYPENNYVQMNIFFLGTGTGFRSHPT